MDKMVQPMTHFVCGLTLRAGSLFTSIFCGVTALISTIVWICLLASDLSSKFNPPKTYDDDNYKHGADFESFYPVMLAILIVLSIISAAQVIVNIVLMIGTIKNNANLVYKWILFYFAFIWLNLVSNIFIAILAYNINTNGNINIAGLMIRALAELGITCYLMTVVHGHYVVMDRAIEKQQRPWKVEPL